LISFTGVSLGDLTSIRSARSSGLKSSDFAQAVGPMSPTKVSNTLQTSRQVPRQLPQFGRLPRLLGFTARVLQPTMVNAQATRKHSSNNHGMLFRQRATVSAVALATRLRESIRSPTIADVNHFAGYLSPSFNPKILASLFTSFSGTRLDQNPDVGGFDTT
jgi:hypothetical protein